MRKNTATFYIAIGLLSAITILACSLSQNGFRGNNADTIATSAAQTLTAFPVLHPLPLVGTETSAPLAGATATASLPTVQATPSRPIVRVSQDTNCRKGGPGQDYDVIGALLVGQSAEVVGKYPPANYWIITNPAGGDLCWLWGQYATVEGDTSQLPVMTPYPLPTQLVATPFSFTLNVKFYDLELCGQSWVLAFEVASPDVGPQGMHSAEAGVMDVTAGNVLLGSMSSNQPFCLHPCGPCDESAGGGAWTIIAVPIGSDPHHGDHAAAKIVACTEDNLRGSCAVADFPFLIP